MPPTKSEIFLLRFARIGSDVVIVLGCVVLLGWAFTVPVLKSVLVGLTPMDPLSACLFILSGIALRRLVTRSGNPGGWMTDWVAAVCGGLVTLGGAAKLWEYLFQVDLGIDLLFFGHSLESVEMPYEEVAPNTALNFILSGLALLLFDVEVRGGLRPAQVLMLLDGLVALLALVGYAYRVLPLYSFGVDMPMPLNSAAAFELVALTGLAARPDRGIVRAVTSNTTGGVMARRLLPAAILIPLLLGGVRYFTEQRGYFETEIGFSLVVVLTMICFAAVIWWNATLLYRADREQEKAEHRLAIQHEVTGVLAESPRISDATIRVLEVICSHLGYPLGAMWSLDDKSEVIRCVQAWYVRPDMGDLARRRLGTTYTPGTGLPGKIWSTGQPLWSDAVARENGGSQTMPSGRVHFRTAFGFPLHFDMNLYGVMEFFTERRQAPEPELLEVLAGVGTQMGQFIERKHAEEQLKQASAELKRSNTDLQQFAYLASHDLSEPLRMIVSYLQLLHDHLGDKLDAEGKEFLGYAVDGAERMRALINDLLAYARVDIRGRPLELVDSGQVLDSALANLRVILEETGAEISRGPLPRVKADSIQLTQVFQNLISNAVKFRRKEAPLRVEIGARQSERQWTFWIRDNGIGIESKQFERIFVLFQRLHTREEYPGTGMGLAICKKIVERHGGRMWVESAPGQGSAFYFTMPSVEEETEVIEAQQSRRIHDSPHSTFN